MAYAVEITALALADTDECIAYIRRNSNDFLPAMEWSQGLKEALRSLASMPERFPRLREPGFPAEDVRQSFYHSHRTVFEVLKESNVVRVLRIYHAARRTFPLDPAVLG